MSRFDELAVAKAEKQKLIDRIQESMDDSEGLNDWEVDFLESIQTQLNGSRDVLEDAQLEKLEDIEYIRAEGREAFWDEKRGNG